MQTFSSCPLVLFRSSIQPMQSLIRPVWQLKLHLGNRIAIAIVWLFLWGLERRSLLTVNIEPGIMIWDREEASWHYYHSPPVTYRCLLVEYCPIRTEEGHRIKDVCPVLVLETDVIDLTLLLRISIVTTKCETTTREWGLMNRGQDRVVYTWGSGDGVLQRRLWIRFELRTKDKNCQ